MMKAIGNFCGLLLFSLLIFGCATDSHFVVTPQSSSALNATNGSEAGYLNHAKVEFVSSSYTGELDSLPVCNVTVENRGEEKVEFSNDMIQVYSGEKLVRLYTALELAELISAAEKEKAEQYDSHQSEVFLGTQSTSSDPSATIARIRAAKRTNQFAGEKKSRDAQLKAISRMIVPTYVQPGERASGYIEMHAEDILPGEPLRIVVNVGDDTFEFVFEVAES